MGLKKKNQGKNKFFKKLAMKELIEASLDQEKILKQLDFKIRHMKPVWIREN